MDKEKPRRKRASKSVRKPRSPAYRSKFESTIGHQLECSRTEYEYEPSGRRIRYVIPEKSGTYLPDFVYTSRSGKEIIIEAKGLWTYEDRYKHLLIKQQQPELDIRFVFQRASNRISKGSKISYRDICEGRGRGIWSGVTWPYSETTIPEEWLKE